MQYDTLNETYFQSFLHSYLSTIILSANKHVINHLLQESVLIIIKIAPWSRRLIAEQSWPSAVSYKKRSAEAK